MNKDSFQLGLLIAGAACIAVSYIAEQRVMRRINFIKNDIKGCTTFVQNGVEVPAEDIPDEVADLFDNLTSVNDIHIKMACNLIRLNIAAVISILNILCILL